MKINSIYEKVKKFYEEGKDYVFITLFLASELDILANEIQKLRKEIEKLKNSHGSESSQ